MGIDGLVWKNLMLVDVVVAIFISDYFVYCKYLEQFFTSFESPFPFGKAAREKKTHSFTYFFEKCNPCHFLCRVISRTS